MIRRGLAFNANTIADKFEISTKAIHRDIEFMRDRLGFEMEYDGSSHSFKGTAPVKRII